MYHNSDLIIKCLRGILDGLFMHGQEKLPCLWLLRDFATKCMHFCCLVARLLAVVNLLFVLLGGGRCTPFAPASRENSRENMAVYKYTIYIYIAI